jgi:hypothetical protein
MSRTQQSNDNQDHSSIKMDSNALDLGQNKSQQHSDDPEMKQELKKTKSKLVQYESAMNIMEQELSQKSKELENTKAQVSLLNKKLENKQSDTSEDTHVENAAIK